MQQQKGKLKFYWIIAADFAKQERYELQPSKTNTIRIKPSNRYSKGKPIHLLHLNESDFPEVEEATHIGLKQTALNSKTAEINVENNMKKARRATYSLMASGLHGQNGLDPETSLQLVKTYILPILLYGLEIILPGKTLIQKLERYQKKLLKQIIFLPQNTPDCAIYILTGFMSIEKQIEKKALIFFNNICNQQEDSIEKRLARRQLSTTKQNSNSCFMNLKILLLKYNLAIYIYR